jgi:ferrous iron transport protein B
MAVIGSFAAREVVIATMGTIFNVGDAEPDSARLVERLQRARWPDGRPLFTLPVALSLIVFFALCCQCASTLAVIKRETASWFWTGFTFVYMTVLAYAGGLVVYQASIWMGS